MKTIVIYNYRSMKRERKSFPNEEKANAYFEQKKSKNADRMVCQTKPNCFTYRNDWGTEIMVQKMY